MKTSELTGPALDWAVAKADGYDEGWLLRQLGNPNPETRAMPSYSTDWSHGGPIIEREGIVCSPEYEDDVLNDTRLLIGRWKANLWNNSVPGTSGFMQWAHGPTPLIAAMRAYVASKLGDEIEIPEELS